MAVSLSKDIIRPGARVAFQSYGALHTGTVTRANPDTSLVWVRPDGFRHERFAHRASITAI
jgi:hypothetical protein